jgi:hypothetical protein
MEQFRAFFPGKQRIGDDWQIFVVHDDQLTGFSGDSFTFGDDHGDLVTDETHPVSEGFVRSRAAQYWLIVHDQAVLVDGHIPGGEDSQHSVQRFGLSGINATNNGMRSTGEENLHIGLVRLVDVAWEEGLTSDFSEGITTLSGLTDRWHRLALRMWDVK